MSRVSFVLASTIHGSLIVNRFDRVENGGSGYGVGYELLERGAYSPVELEQTIGLLRLRQKYYGDGVLAIDCGANIGVMTVQWAKAMQGWGGVLAFEPQERLYYALAGNIALNNCLNARAYLAAVGNAPGVIKVPALDYQQPGSFGSLSLIPNAANDVGQDPDWSDCNEVQVMPIDALQLERTDLIKIDVEGMEMATLDGATQTIQRARPMLMVEHIKSDKRALAEWITGQGYRVFDAGGSLFAAHTEDKIVGHVVLPGLTI